MRGDILSIVVPRFGAANTNFENILEQSLIFFFLLLNVLVLTFAGAKSFAADTNDGVVNAVVVIQATQRAVRSVICATQEGRLHNGTRVTPPATHRHICDKCP
jgi:hypothetical protein